MQEGRTEQNERRTLQREFNVRSLEKREHTPQHLSDSLRKNSLSRNVRASRRSHHPPNGGSRGASKGGCEGLSRSALPPITATGLQVIARDFSLPTAIGPAPDQFSMESTSRRTSRGNKVRFWHKADINGGAEHVRSWGVMRTSLIYARVSANDPKRTFMSCAL
jgi:hypothetical protein